MAPGASTTCGICGAVIETPARDLIINGETLAFGCVIDLDQNAQDVRDHYAAKHPDADLPERVW